MQKIKKNDEIIVIAGKDKGKKGKVLRMLPEKNRAVVEGINLVKKHEKANPQAGIAGGVVSKEAAIHLSNIAIFNHKTNKADKVIFKVLEDNKKVRCFKSNQEQIDI